MAAKPVLPSKLSLLFFLHLNDAFASPDLTALLDFKSSADTSNSLSRWTTTTGPCSWPGVSCIRNRVSRLVLENHNLNGSFQPLTRLTELRVLSLKGNHFSGPIPDLSNLTSLKLLFLSHNGLSGDFPASLTSLSRLYRLDLSFNKLARVIPASQVNGLTHLLTLRLEGNGFSGQISGLNLPNLQDFNVSYNELSGQIPFSLSGFPESTFLHNAFLCGAPLPSCSSARSDPTRPGSSSGAMASPVGNLSTVASSPTTIPENGSPIKSRKSSGGSKMSTVAIVFIILGDVVVLVGVE